MDTVCDSGLALRRPVSVPALTARGTGEDENLPACPSSLGKENGNEGLVDPEDGPVHDRVAAGQADMFVDWMSSSSCCRYPGRRAGRLEHCRGYQCTHCDIKVRGVHNILNNNMSAKETYSLEAKDFCERLTGQREAHRSQLTSVRGRFGKTLPVSKPAAKKNKVGLSKSTGSSSSRNSLGSRSVAATEPVRGRRAQKSGRMGKDPSAQLQAEFLRSMAADAGCRDAITDADTEYVPVLSAAGGSADAVPSGHGDLSKVAPLRGLQRSWNLSSMVHQNVSLPFMKAFTCSPRLAAVGAAVRDLGKGRIVTGMAVWLASTVMNVLISRPLYGFLKLIGKPLVRAAPLTNIAKTIFGLVGKNVESTPNMMCRLAFGALHPLLPTCGLFGIFATRFAINLLRPYQEEVVVTVVDTDSEYEPDDVRSASASRDKAQRQSEWTSLSLVQISTSVLTVKTSQSELVVNTEVLNEILALDRSRPGLSWNEFKLRILNDHAVLSVVNADRADLRHDFADTYVLAEIIWRMRKNNFDVSRLLLAGHVQPLD